MRKLLNRKIVEQKGICAICDEEFTDCGDVVPYADIGIRDNIVVIGEFFEANWAYAVLLDDLPI